MRSLTISVNIIDQFHLSEYIPAAGFKSAQAHDLEKIRNTQKRHISDLRFEKYF